MLFYLAAGVAVVGGLAAVSAVALTSNDKVSFPTGSGTATITWHSTSSAGSSSQFAGTVAGIPVQGDAVATPPQFGNPTNPLFGNASNASPTLPSKLPLARWTGTFEGKAFDLNVALSFRSPQSTSPAALSAQAEVDGSYGGEPVHLTSDFSNLDATANSLSFSGTVGRYHVTGTVRPTGGASSNTAQASFVVTG